MAGTITTSASEARRTPAVRTRSPGSRNGQSVPMTAVAPEHASIALCILVPRSASDLRTQRHLQSSLYRSEHLVIGGRGAPQFDGPHAARQRRRHCPVNHGPMQRRCALRPDGRNQPALGLAGNRRAGHDDNAAVECHCSAATIETRQPLGIAAECVFQSQPPHQNDGAHDSMTLPPAARRDCRPTRTRRA